MKILVIKIEFKEVRIDRSSKRLGLQGIEISYKIDDQKQWNVINLTNEEGLKFTTELASFMGMKISQN